MSDQKYVNKTPIPVRIPDDWVKLDDGKYMTHTGAVLDHDEAMQVLAFVGWVNQAPEEETP